MAYRACSETQPKNPAADRDSLSDPEDLLVGAQLELDMHDAANKVQIRTFPKWTPQKTPAEFNAVLLSC